MKKYDGVLWFIGFCAFVALFCSGCAWLLGSIGASWSFLGKLKGLATIALTIVASICGWLWLSTLNINKTFKLVLEIFFVLFAILAVIGYISWL